MRSRKEFKPLNMRVGMCAVMLILCAILFVFLRNRDVEIDTVAPLLSVEEGDIKYTEGEDTQVLLQGVSAKDNMDGDVTESIRVRSIHYADDSDHAIVTYVAKDGNNNIGFINRKVDIQRAASSDKK